MLIPNHNDQSLKIIVAEFNDSWTEERRKLGFLTFNNWTNK